jgi:hypothetical protein
MRLDTGLAFVFGETVAFLRQAWWLAMAAILPNLALYVLRHVAVPWNETANLWIVSATMAIANVALTYWVIRFIALKRDVSAALEVNRASARTFLPYAVAAFCWIGLSVPLASITGGWNGFALRLSPELLYFFAPWPMTSPSGSTVIGPIRSLKLIAPHLAWAIGILALLLLVYVLFAAAIGLLAALLLPATAILFFMNGSSLAGACARAILEVMWDVAFIAATYALALRTGIRVSGTERLRAIFE